MARPKIGMTDRKKRAAEMIGQGMSDKAVLEELKIPGSTLWRWERDDIFLDACLLESKRYLLRQIPVARSVLMEQASSLDAADKWLRQNAANSILREHNTTQGTGKSSIVVTFALDDTVPAMPELDETDSPDLLDSGDDDMVD